MWNVYVDWTLEALPRAFYVGKGDDVRVSRLNRNQYHTNVRRKYGIRREVVLVTSVENLAFDHEINLIAELKTQRGVVGCWGTNLTTGGEGLRDPSDDTRQRMRTSWRETREFRLQRLRDGWKHRAPDTMETRQKKSDALERRGSPSQATRDKISVSKLGKKSVKRAEAIRLWWAKRKLNVPT